MDTRRRQDCLLKTLVFKRAIYLVFYGIDAESSYDPTLTNKQQQHLFSLYLDYLQVQHV